MSTSLLHDFEQQYSVQTAEITARIGRLSSLEKHERLNGIQQVQRLLVDVESLLEQMELSVREIDASSYRNDKKQLDSELDKAIGRLKENADRDELMAFDNEISLDQHGNCNTVSKFQQDHLIENTERLERTSRRLHDTYRMVVETEQVELFVCTSILFELQCNPIVRGTLLEV
ncbi:unnamed protein product, partial [Anisakis simplex]|uniref:V-SNARE domain-containing protein n=1 Tax=Anisakis simplex TaxID=6269 RepID=A0A0M3KJP8_ANISI